MRAKRATELGPLLFKLTGLATGNNLKDCATQVRLVPLALMKRNTTACLTTQEDCFLIQMARSACAVWPLPDFQSLNDQVYCYQSFLPKMRLR